MLPNAFLTFDKFHQYNKEFMLFLDHNYLQVCRDELTKTF